MRGSGLDGAAKAISHVPDNGVWIAYRMYMRGDNFITSTLPPSSIMVLVEAFNIQFNWDKPQGRHAVTAHGILHWECRVVHEAVRAVQVVKSLRELVSRFNNSIRG